MEAYEPLIHLRKYFSLFGTNLNYHSTLQNSVQHNPKSIYALFPKGSERLQRNLNIAT